MRHVAIYAALLLAGCSDLLPTELEDLIAPNDTNTSTSTATSPSATESSVRFTLVKTAIAGEAASWSADLLDPQGEAIVGLEWTVASDVEAITDTPDGLIATLAVSHTITVTTSHQGNEHSASATLDVAPAAVADLDVDISPDTIEAGQIALWSLTAADAYGNAVAGDDAIISATDLTIVADSVTGALAGAHTLTATLDGATDSVTLTVEPGVASSINLTLDPSSGLQPGDTAVARVLLMDRYGNEADDEWSLSAVGGAFDIDEDEITFETDGVYTVTATSDDLADSVGPIVVDGNAPTIVITQPSRGDFQESPNVRVRGTVSDTVTGTPSTFVNGVELSLNAYGAFDQTIYLPEPGIQTLIFQAYDDSGNVRETHRSVHLGDTVALGASAYRGLQVRMENDSGGLDALETLADGLVTAAEIEAMLPDPVFRDSSETCVWGACFTWYSVYLTIDNFNFDGTNMTLTPLSSGRLRAKLDILDPEVDWDADAVGAEIPYSGSGDITADKLSITMELTPRIVSGAVVLDVYSVTASSSNFRFDMDGWLYDILEFFSFDGSSMVEGYLLDAMEVAARDAVPALMEDALSDIDLGFALAMADNTFYLDAEMEDIDVDSYGLTLSVDPAITVESWESPHTGPGSLFVGYDTPTWSGATGTSLAISLDTFNQLLYAVWGSGSLTQTLDPAALGLDPSALDMLGGSEIIVEIDGLLPPVAVPGTMDAPYELQIGSMYLSVRLGETGPTLLSGYASGSAELFIDSDGGTSILPTIGDLNLQLDMVEPETEPADVVALVDDLLPLFLPSLTDALGAFEVPTIAGFGIEDLEVSTTDGYVNLEGNLRVD